jgi:Ca2+-binding EF-hand superfamily protein
MRSLIQQFDQDRNGKLNSQERTIAAQALLTRLDQDGSGTLSKTEWASLGNKQTSPIPRRQVPSYLGRYDLDQDGKVTIEEIQQVRRQDQGGSR